MQGQEEITVDEAKYFEALSYTRSSQLHDAVRVWKEIVAEEPKFALAHFNLGQLYDKLSLFDLALDSYEAARRHDPEKAIYHANLGGVYMKLGMNKDALRVLQEAATKDPYNYMVDYNLAGTYMAMSDHDSALLHADKAVDLYSSPGTNESGVAPGVDRVMLAKLLARQAECHVARKEMEKARQCADRIVKQCRETVPTRLQAMLDEAPPAENAEPGKGS